MRQRVTIVVSAALLAVGACEAGPELARDEFDGAFAESLVRRQVAFGPRVPGTEPHAATLAWLVEFLSTRADTVEAIPFTHVTTVGDTVHLTNVFARFRPEAGQRVLLLAHWDSRPVAEQARDPAARRQPVPGANDGASGVAVLLTIADRMNRVPPGLGVDVLLTDGEDWGYDPQTLSTVAEDMFLGARHFARTHRDYRPLFGILLDLVGDQNPVFPWEGHSLRSAPEVVTRVWDVARELGYVEVFVPRAGPPIGDDHVPLNEVGIRTINVIDFDYPYWHTPEDTPDKVSAETLDIVGEVILEVLRRQGGS
jgi:glutaminyl-peptide cyclotransferase